jgi:urate oxidase
MSHLSHNAYGKSRIRLTRVTRHTDRHDLKELCIDVRLEGDFAGSYLRGDNSKVVATDSMKNTIYVLAKKHSVGAIETFAGVVADHFLKMYAHVSSAAVTVVETPWTRLKVDGEDHPSAFVGGGSDRRMCAVTVTRHGQRIESGFDDLALLKTTDSAFSGFIHDEFTTLRDTDDRIFATLLSARWRYRETPGDWDRSYDAVRQALLRVFAQHKSLAVQHTLYAMGQGVLDAAAEVEEITLQMPNRHNMLVDLKPFGLENRNEVFVATDEPHGMITGTVRR